MTKKSARLRAELAGRTNFDGPTSAVLDAAANEFVDRLDPWKVAHRLRAACNAYDVLLGHIREYLVDTGLDTQLLDSGHAKIREFLR